MIIISALKLNEKWTLDHTGMLANVAFENHFMDWVNRSRLIYSHQNIDATLFTWHNNKVFDKAEHVSVGLNVSYTRIKVSQRISLSSGITELRMIKKSELSSFDTKHGIAFTIAAALAISRQVPQTIARE